MKSRQFSCLLRWLLSALVVLPALFYLGLIVRGKLELGGASPGPGVLGRGQDLSQRAMTQYCTGVSVTPESTWLVGQRDDVAPAELAITAQAHDLSRLLPHGEGEQGRGELTLVSRLNPTRGEFELLAWLPASACLHATPDGKRLFLLTGLDHPAENPMQQTAVFQSDDQGKTWQWRQEGLFPQAGMLATGLQPQFFGPLSVWAWDRSSPAYGAAPPPPEDSGLLYSPDGGTHVQRVLARPDWLLGPQQAAALRGDRGARWEEGEARELVLERHVWQLGPQRALVWVTQAFNYAQEGDAEGEYPQRFVVSTQVELRFEAGGWHMARPQRMPDVWVERILASPGGPVLAVMQKAGREASELMALNLQDLQWQRRGELSGAFGPLGGRISVREQHYVAGQTLLLNTRSRHQVLAWLRPWSSSPANISANSVHASTDGGRSWTRLAMPGYLGLMGFDPLSHKVFWAEGHWYNSHDPAVRSYQLSR